MPKYIPVVFHNLSKYDAHLFIRELAKEFRVDEMECIAENVEKYISFSVPIRVEIHEMGKPVIVKNKKTGKEEVMTKKCMLRFIDSCRFMQRSLSDLVDNLAGTNAEGVKCERCRGEMEFVEINADYIAKFECINCYYTAKRQLDEDDLKKRFSNTYRYCGDDECFRLMLRKGVYPYEYMDSFDRFDKMELPTQERFYSNLNLSDISRKDYMHAQRVWKKFECRDLGDYHFLYLSSDVLLLVDVFENFRDVCQRIYDLDPAHFYTSPGLAWQAALKKTGVTINQ